MATWNQQGSGSFLGGIGLNNTNAPRASDANATLAMIRENNDLQRSGENNFGLQAMQGLAGLNDMYQQSKAQEREKEFQSQWGQAYANGDRDAMRQLMATYPDQAEKITGGMKGISDDIRESIGNVASGYRLAVASGKPEDFIRKNADEMRRLGIDPQYAYEQAQKAPKAAMELADHIGMSALGMDKYYDVRDKMEGRAETNRHNLAAEANTREGNALSYQSAMTGHSIAAQRLALDKDKFAFDQQQAIQKSQALIEDAPKLSVNMEKNIETAVTDASNSRNSANSMMSLATQFRTEIPRAGLAGNVSNTVNQLMGSDTAMRDLRIRQNALVNNQVLKFLPPGPATDRDVEIVREGAPTTMDSPEVVARWLDGMARMEQRSAAFNDFKAEWFSANGNPGQARTDREIMGMQVKKGESLNAAAKRYMANYEKELSPSNHSPAKSSTQQSQQSGDYSNLWGG
ncbi:TPA: phage DNA ejection protein [Providencia alcalifaciens]